MEMSYARTRTNLRPSRPLVRDQRVDVVPLEPFPAAEEGELDDEARSCYFPAEPLHKPADGLDGAAGGEHVVVDHDARAGRDQVGMYLERVLAVLEQVAR